MLTGACNTGDCTFAVGRVEGVPFTVSNSYKYVHCYLDFLSTFTIIYQFDITGIYTYIHLKISVNLNSIF